MTPASPEDLRHLLCALGAAVRDRVIAGRVREGGHLADVAGSSEADTIYRIDRFGEEAICEWFDQNWPASEPVEVIMEGLETGFCCPRSLDAGQTRWKCILDPVDGTRGIMYDKRSAWSLGAVAPQRGPATRLSEIIVAAMTELPTSKQWRADQLSACRGQGLQAEAFNLFSGERQPLRLAPTQAADFRHGFAWLAKFFPEGRALTARIEEEIWRALIGLGRDASPTVFDDQYISTGGAFYELLAGHDRMSGDLRPIVLAKLGLPSSLVCHPYDACTALLLEEAGIVYEHPLGGFPDGPLDLTSPVAWVAYANPTLASLARPVLQRVIRELCSS